MVSLPTMGTQISDEVTGPGRDVTDTIVVQGTGGTAGHIVATLYGYGDPGVNKAATTITQDQWRKLIDDGDATAIGTVELDVAGDGTYTTPKVTLDDTSVGAITWAESATWADTTHTTTTPPGETTETGIVISPTVTTKAHASSHFTGATFGYTNMVEGSYGQDGTLSGEVRGPIAGQEAG